MFSQNSGPAKSRSVGAFVFERSKYGSSCFKRQKVWELSLEINYPKCGSSRFKRSKVWELPLYTSTSVGAPVLSVQKCGSFHLECPKCGSTRVKLSKVGELSFETTRSVGALALNA